MGVKIGITKATAELYPQGEYLLKVLGNEIDKTSGKIKINFIIAQGPMTGKSVNRKFNPKVSQMSDLGKLLAELGVPVNDATAGQQLDLDVINGHYVFGYNSHYALPNGNGMINSLTNFRRAEGGTLPTAQAVQPQAQAPAPQLPPQGYPQPQPSVQQFQPVVQPPVQPQLPPQLPQQPRPQFAAVPQYVPPVQGVVQAPATAPKLDF